MEKERERERSTACREVLLGTYRVVKERERERERERVLMHACRELLLGTYKVDKNSQGERETDTPTERLREERVGEREGGREEDKQRE
jgi:hypothetical protein